MANIERLIQIGIDARKAKSGGNEVQQSLRGVSNEARRAQHEVSGLGKTIEGIADGVKEFGKEGLLKVFGGIGIAAVTGFFIKEVVELRDELNELANTTGREGEALDDLARRLLNVGSRLPSTTKELFALAGAASQLGVDGNEGIEKFIENMTRIGLVTDLRGAEAAKSLGRLLKAANEPIEKVDELGAAVNRLTSAFGTGGQEQVAYATSIVQLTERFGVSAREALSLSAAIGRIGGEGGQSAIVLSRILSQLPKEFVNSFGSGRGADAVVAFLQGLNAMRKSGEDLQPVLESLGIDNVRLEKAVRPLIAGSNELARALKLTADPAENLKALVEESDRAAGSTSNQLSKLRGSLVDAAQAIGGDLEPVLASAVGGLNELVQALFGVGGTEAAVGEGAKRLAAALQAMGVAAAIAFGPAIISGASKMATSLLKAAAASEKLTFAMKGILVALVALVAFDFGSYLFDEFKVVQKGAQDFITFVDKSWETIKYGAKLTVAYIDDAWKNLFGVSLRKSFASYLADFADGLKSIEDLVGVQIGGAELAARAKSLLQAPDSGETFDDAKVRIARELQDALDEAEKIRQTRLAEIEREFGESGRRTGRSYFEAAGEGIKDAVDKVKELLGIGKKELEQAGVSDIDVSVKVDTAGADEAANAIRKMAASLGKAGEEARKARDELDKLFAQLRLEKELIGQTNDARERSKSLQEALTLITKAYADNQTEANFKLLEYAQLLRDVQIARHVNELREANKQIDQQTQLLGEDIAIRRHSAEVIRFATEAEEAYGKGTQEATDAIEKFKERIKNLDELERLQALVDQIGERVGSAFESMIFDAKSFKDALADTVKEISRLVFQTLVTQQIASLVSGSLGSAFGLGATAAAPKAALGLVVDRGDVMPFASGGVNGGRITSGPELFPLSGGRVGLRGEVPGQAEGILPLQRGPRGLGVAAYGGRQQQVANVYVTINARDASSFRESGPMIQQQFGKAVRRAFR